MGRKSIAHETQHAFDLYANAYTVIQEPHRMSHDGFMFHSSGKVLAVANGADFEILLVTSAFNYPHMQRMSLNVGRGDIDVLVYEDAVASADGTVIGARNVNRNSSLTPDMVITHTPTLTGDGTLIHTNWIPPTGSGIGSSGGAVDIKTNGEEWILAPSTKYLVRITNESGGAIDMRYEVVWYEIGDDAEA